MQEPLPRMASPIQHAQMLIPRHNDQDGEKSSMFERVVDGIVLIDSRSLNSLRFVLIAGAGLQFRPDGNKKLLKGGNPETFTNSSAVVPDASEICLFC